MARRLRVRGEKWDETLPASWFVEGPYPRAYLPAGIFRGPSENSCTHHIGGGRQYPLECCCPRSVNRPNIRAGCDISDALPQQLCDRRANPSAPLPRAGSDRPSQDSSCCFPPEGDGPEPVPRRCPHDRQRQPPPQEACGPCALVGSRVTSPDLGYGGFRQVRVEAGTLTWPGDLDFNPDMLIWDGAPPSEPGVRPAHFLRIRRPASAPAG